MKLKYQYAVQAVADSFLAMALGNDPEAQSNVLRMNKTGRDMLEMLQQETSEDEMVQKLQEKYEGPEAQIRASVQKFTARLKEQDLLA